MHALHANAIAANAMSRRSQLTWWGALGALLFLGYTMTTRSFAHIGVGPIFIGEVALAGYLISRPSRVTGPLVTSLNRPTWLSGPAWLLYASLTFGIVQCLRGVFGGYGLIIPLQNVVFHVYPLYLLPGLWIGTRHRDMMPKLVRWLAWGNGIYGVAYLLFLSRLNPEKTAESFGASLFGEPAGAAIALLGLLCYERKLTRSWLPLLLNAVVLLGLQVRAEWVGFAVCLALWAYLTGKLDQLFKLAFVLLGLLAIAWVSDARIPSSSRAREISARHIVGRGLAAIDPETATRLSADVDSYAGTVDWRTGWWREMWRETHRTNVTTLFGPGYGFPIWDLHPEELPEPVRTPHNAFMYALAYTGWSGVVLFYAFQFSLAVMLWRVYRRTGQPFGLCFWALIVVWAHFDNVFETPYGAIPFYLVVGICASELFRRPNATSL